MSVAAATGQAGSVGHTAGGVIAALLTVSIWGGWIVATRHSVTTHLGPVDIGILRYGVPALLLTPFWWRVGPLPKGVSPWALAVIVAGSGAPFFLLVSLGMGHAPAAHAGALLPGTMPLWTGLLGWALLRERFGRVQGAGYAFMVAGIFVLGGAEVLNGDGTAWRGHLAFLGGAAMWAAYTHAFRRSGLTPLQAAGVVAMWSLAVHLGLAAALGTDLPEVPAGELALQLATQGVLSGVVATGAYGIAVRRLGSARAAAFSALTPVLAMAGGAALLTEIPTMTDLVAMAATVLGVTAAAAPQTPKGPARRSGDATPDPAR